MDGALDEEMPVSSPLALRQNGGDDGGHGRDDGDAGDAGYAGHNDNDNDDNNNTDDHRQKRARGHSTAAPAPGDQRYPRRRALRACGLCRVRKTKCDNRQPACGSCAALGTRCSYGEADHSAYVGRWQATWQTNTQAYRE